MSIKPKLTKQISVTDFESHYWLKAELAQFCKINALSTVGSKQELTERIKTFLVTGEKIKPQITKAAIRDSLQSIEINTPVKNYNNDAATRRFFISQIGDHFHFNAYLRQFTNKSNITPNLTYGDLVKGWLLYESKKNNSRHKTKIDKQFEYNQFVRDFFTNEKAKSLADVIKAWRILKALPGLKNYANYRLIKKKK